jgi:cobalt-zinc-cadmium efflux system protein
MSHSHHDHSHDHQTGNITVAFWLNTSFAIIELAGGLLTNSVAILSDALHDFGDSLSLATSWYFQKKSQQKRDAVFTYGYKRFSLLGAIVNSVVLLVGSVFIIREAITRLVSPQQPDAKGMILLAVLGIVVNGFAVLRLRKGNSINERVISLHFIEDVLGWFAVLIGAVIMLFVYVPVLDPILSIGIASYILFNVYRNMRSSFQIILQGVPEKISEKEIKEILTAFPEIKNIHDVHVWSMDGNYNVLTMHVVVGDAMDMGSLEILKTNIKLKLKKMHIDHATIELETDKMNCEHLE